jgi:SAM-dependent methyltransferase
LNASQIQYALNNTHTTSCSICGSKEHNHYITTNALMHTPNSERYEFRKCGMCETVFLSNPVSEPTLENYYTQYYLPYRGAAAWGKYASFVEGSQKQLDAKRVKLLSKVANKNTPIQLLDIGCGNPTFLQLAQHKLNATCTGIDFSDNGWKHLKVENIALFQTSLANFDCTQQYDVITLWHYLEHDYHLQQTANKLYDCLKPGGKLIIEVPDYNSLTARLQQQYWQGWHSPRHITLFSAKGFRKLFGADRWDIVSHHRYGTLDAFTLWWLGRMEAKQINWSGLMEHAFWPLVALKVATFPIFLFEKFLPMGIQTLVVQKK